ncbi:MAG: iron ABC transporter permease [Chloroflexia bacterium]|nr:iron ABC transporter permease [Chloroflexia bacterium]
MLTLRPRAARAVTLPAVRRGEDTQTASQQRRALSWSGERPPLWVVLPAVLVAILELLPLLYLVARTFEASANIWPVLLRARTVEVVLNTVALAGAVALATIVIAVPLAWLTTRTDLPGRAFWSVAAALPLVIPSYIGAVVIVAAFGPRGMLQSALAPFGVERLPSIYGFAGSWLTLTLFTYPYVYLTVRAALRGFDPSLEEAARCLGFGPWRSFFAVTLPQIRPAAAAGGLLVALYAIGDFGVVTLLRYDAFTRAIYVQYRAAMDRGGAAMLALLLVALSIVVLVVELRARGNATLHRLGSGAGRRGRPVALGRATVPALLFCALVVGLALALPIAILGAWLVRSFSAGTDLSGLPAATMHSLTLGFWTALIATACALPIAVLLVRYPGGGARLVERLAYLGYALPGLVVALAFVAFGAGTPVYQTLLMLIGACVVRFLPEAVSSVRAALLQVSPRLEEAARGLGRSQVGAVASVTAPLARSGILAGAALVLLTAMKELPATLLLSPTGWDTLAVEVWTAANDAAYGDAAAPALILIVVAAVPMLLFAPRDGVREQAP